MFRDGETIKFCDFEGVGGWEQRGKLAVFRGKHHDNKIVKVQISGRPRFGSVRLRFGDGTVRAVPVCGSGGFLCKKGFSVFRYNFSRRGRFRFRFRFQENGSGGSGSAFGFGKTVPTVPVSGSGSVPALSFLSLIVLFLPRRTPNLPRIFLPAEPRENTQITKEIPCLKFTKEIQTIKERKDRVSQSANFIVEEFCCHCAGS